MGKIDGGLRALFRANVPGDWTSIESGTTGGGIPDSNYCIRGAEGWVEHKQAEGWAVTLRPEQVGWIMRRVRNGGRVWVAVRRANAGGPRRGEAVDELWLLRGRLAVEAKAGGLRPLDGAPGVHCWHHGPSAWDWRAVARVLAG